MLASPSAPVVVGGRRAGAAGACASRAGCNRADGLRSGVGRAGAARGRSACAGNPEDDSQAGGGRPADGAQAIAGAGLQPRRRCGRAAQRGDQRRGRATAGQGDDQPRHSARGGASDAPARRCALRGPRRRRVRGRQPRPRATDGQSQPLASSRDIRMPWETPGPQRMSHPVVPASAQPVAEAPVTATSGKIRMPWDPPAPASGEAFSGGLDKSLDEVILEYLADDGEADER